MVGARVLNPRETEPRRCRLGDEDVALALNVKRSEGHKVKTTALNSKLKFYTYVQRGNLKVSRPIKVQHRV